MTYLFFEEVLAELGKKLNYDAVVNYAGNSFAKDSWQMIEDSNPMTMKDRSHKLEAGLADFFSKVNIKTIKTKGKGSGGHGRIED